MSHLRPSQWTYRVDRESGASADAMIASGGIVTLCDPNGKPQQFYFGRSGISAPSGDSSQAIVLPLMVLPEPAPVPAKAVVTMPEPQRAVGEQVERLAEGEQVRQVIEGKPAGTNEPAPKQSDEKAQATPNSEAPPSVFMTDSFFGHELSLSDMRGGAVFVDARMRLYPGADMCALLLGINASEMSFGLSSPETFWMAERVIARARAVVLMRDVTVGVHADPYLNVLPGYMN